MASSMSSSLGKIPGAADTDDLAETESIPYTVRESDKAYRRAPLLDVFAAIAWVIKVISKTELACDIITGSADVPFLNEKSSDKPEQTAR